MFILCHAKKIILSIFNSLSKERKKNLSEERYLNLIVLKRDKIVRKFKLYNNILYSTVFSLCYSCKSSLSILKTVMKKIMLLLMSRNYSIKFIFNLLN